MALLLDPPTVLVSIDRGSTSWPDSAKGGQFAVNILSNQQEDIAKSFARSGGSKFDGVEWAPGSLTGAPVIAECQAWVECRTWRTYDGGDHVIVAARVLALDQSATPRRIRWCSTAPSFHVSIVTTGSRSIAEQRIFLHDR
jgi:3-hydroxy-9,10-secoandrosta-1,3,5(10)-triene-9,17-dione monooxygenase reductase component